VRTKRNYSKRKSCHSSELGLHRCVQWHKIYNSLVDITDAKNTRTNKRYQDQQLPFQFEVTRIPLRPRLTPEKFRNTRHYYIIVVLIKRYRYSSSLFCGKFAMPAKWKTTFCHVQLLEQNDVDVEASFLRNAKWKSVYEQRKSYEKFVCGTNLQIKNIDLWLILQSCH